MRSYSYSPPRGDAFSRAIVFALLGGAAVIVLFGEFLTEYKPIFQTAGFLPAIAGVMFYARFLLSGYTYTVEVSAEGSGADLVIVENRGKANRTVCRVSAVGGNLLRAKRGEGRSFDYRPTPFAEPSYYYEVSERDGGGYVRFCPDEKMVQILSSLGCEVEE